MVKREYIGDGVYVLYDGNGFWLYANDLEKPTDAIYLEQEVLDALAVAIRRGNPDSRCPETINYIVAIYLMVFGILGLVG